MIKIRASKLVPGQRAYYGGDWYRFDEMIEGKARLRAERDIPACDPAYFEQLGTRILVSAGEAIRIDGCKLVEVES